MTDPTPVTEEVTPPSAETEQPSQESTESVEALKEKLAAEQKAKEDALEEAKRWKGRVKEENPPKKKDPEEEYADWRIDNKDRIALVKEPFEKELSELQESGAKLTISLREKALQLAEAKTGVKKAEKSDPIPSGTIDRGGSVEPMLSDWDRQFGIKPETKKKYGHLESTW